jgi:multidrug resistance efflux pump
MTTLPDRSEQQVRRRNWRLTLVLVVIALAFYVGFFIAVSNR